MSMMLELYETERCLYCKKVKEKMNELGLSYVTHDPRHNENYKEKLLDLGGKNQVPFLVIKNGDGEIKKTMYESDQIVDYLEQEYS